MDRLLDLLSRIRIRRRHSSTLLKCVVLVTIVVCTVTLITLRMDILGIREDTEALRQQAVALEQENKALTQRIAEAGTVKSLRQIAAEELGLVDPDSEFFATQENNQ